MMAVFGKEYLPSLTEQHNARIMAHNATIGFYGMFWEYGLHALAWKNCPFAWQGLYKGHTEEVESAL
jgi:hypothetical protein